MVYTKFYCKDLVVLGAHPDQTLVIIIMFFMGRPTHVDNLVSRTQYHGLLPPPVFVTHHSSFKPSRVYVALDLSKVWVSQLLNSAW